MSPACSTLHYKGIDYSKPVYSVEVSDVVKGDIDLSYKLTSDWSKESPFWSKSLDITSVDKKGKENGVGDVRHFKTNGREYAEVLLDAIPKEHTFAYGLVSMTPPMLSGAITTAQFQPLDSGKFRVTWSNKFQPSADYPALVATVKAGQTVAYEKLIAGIKFVNNPLLGVAKIGVCDGMASGGPDYLHIRVANRAVTTLNTHFDGSLKDKSSKAVEHKIMEYDDHVTFSLVDRVYFGDDTEIGRGYIAVRDLSDDTKKMDLLLKDTAGRVVGKYTVTASVNWLHAEPTDAASSFGMAAFKVFDTLKTEVFKIAEAAVVHQLKPQKLEYSDYDVEAFGQLPKFCKVLPAGSAIMPNRLGELFQRNTEYLFSQAPILGLIGILSDMSANPEMLQTPAGKMALQKLMPLLEDPFMSPFTGMWMPEPKQMIENLKDPIKSDLELCAQLIRGVNPMKVELAKSAEQLPQDFQALTDNQGRDLSTMIEENCLFFCDYKNLAFGEYVEELGVFKNQATNINGTGPLGPMKYWYAPFLAVFKNEDGKLDILGFTLTRFTDKPNTVYRRETTPTNLYALAKFHLTCADNQDHQWVQHLGMAHLCMESFAIANENCFPDGKDRHPVGKLLQPHFQDTIGINFLARQTLVSEIAPFTDATFSPGTANAMKIFSDSYKKWDFFGSNFKNALLARGFDEECSDGLEGFYYREDGFKLWDLFLWHFSGILTKLYDTDEEVENDVVLQGWCVELRDPKRGNIASFPEKIDSVHLLAEVLTTIVFQCSAQHAAVNYSQLRYVAYVPNRPNQMRTPMLEPLPGEEDIAEDLLYASLPSIASGQFQTMFSYLLSTPPDNPFSMYDTYKDEFPLEVEGFMAALKSLSGDIRERNDKLVDAGDVPYEYLDPMQLAQSINI